MKAPQRRNVIWVGPLPEGAESEFNKRDLRLERVASSSEVLPAVASGTRAVLVVFTPSIRESLAPLYYPILDSGALLSVVLPDEGTSRTDRAVSSEAVATLKKAEPGRVKTLNGWAIHEVAQACASHDPGRDGNPSLAIEKLDASLVTTASHELLLKRAFSDFERISIRRLQGSYAPDPNVWYVEAFDKGTRPYEPFAVKVGNRRNINEEIESTLNFVSERVPFPHSAPLRLERCVEGATERLCVSMFVSRAVRFDNYLDAGSPGLSVTAIFDGPLRTWRQSPRREEVALGDVYRGFGVLPRDPSDLEKPYQEAVKRRAVKNPTDLFGVLMGLPRMQVSVCHAHGDLHPRNIYVRHNSIDVVLIDFASARYEGPISRDPATLDVSLAFTDIGGKASLPEDTLFDLYRSPVLPPSRVKGDDCRLDAIKRVRLHAWGDGAVTREYEIAIACYLLRFARLKPDDTRSALAYDIADTLIATPSL